MTVGAATPELPKSLQPLASTASGAHAKGYAPGHHDLIRPDGYLALSTPSDHPSAIFDRLRRWLPV